MPRSFLIVNAINAVTIKMEVGTNSAFGANVPFAEYLKLVYNARETVEKEGAANFIPYAFSAILKSSK
ncbi:MAG: hypothetical protein HQK50_14105 [Oligoflexia bacterium]|nr:hypothetical protein [Oligoflexia bacterium]